MTFKIVSVGWQCAEWIEQTLRSVEVQTTQDWEIAIIYDQSDDNGAEVIKNWCNSRDPRGRYWHYQINEDRRFAVRNQYDAIQMLAPADDDIVVWLDLDGDMLADKNTLRRLASYYDDNTLLTYGSYQPVPAVGPPMRIEPYPPRVVRDRSYRAYTLNGGCCFNHLRTMKGIVAKSIPVGYLQWPDGRWYEIGTDYVFMMAGLELADGRYKCIRETLLLYNHANPYADNISHDKAGVSCVIDCLNRPPLEGLPR